MLQNLCIDCTGDEGKERLADVGFMIEIPDFCLEKMSFTEMGI